MIISASRRTDIPALYTDWFINRLHAGYLLVRNPLNKNQVSKIELSPEEVDCIVFWTKNALPILKHLSYLDRFNYYFHFTITAYDSSIEMNLPEKDKIIDTFRRLADAIGPERVIWRYDPVFYTGQYNLDYHLEYFNNLSKKLSGYTERCMYSFLTVYKKCEKNMREIVFSKPSLNDIINISEQFSKISASNKIALQTCAENIDLSDFGIIKGKCIDDNLIKRISGKTVSPVKDKNQRDACQCISSIDIGAYNTCTHKCIYCYANHDHIRAEKNFNEHRPDSELLYGILDGAETIKLKKNIVTQSEDKQGSLF